MCIIIKKIKDIEFSSAHGGEGRKKELITNKDIINPHFDVLNKDYLLKGNFFDWHKHEGSDEICIVVEGKGNIKYLDENHVKQFERNDVILINSGEMHKIEAEENAIFYFVE